MTTHTALTVARRAITAIASLAAIAALVVGVPVLLWRLAGWPLPTELPSPDGISRAISSSTVSDTLLVNALALIGWFSWALICWSFLAEIWAVIRGIPASRRSLAGPFQTLARHLVASVSLLTITGMSSTTSAAIAVTTPSSAVVELREPVLAAAVSPATTSTFTPQARAATAGAVAAPAIEEPSIEGSAVEESTVDGLPAATYIVQRRDSLWRIAECELGDPLRWRELWELNRGRDFGGVTFTDPNLIHPGWVLHLPTPTTTELAPSTAPPPVGDDPPPAPARTAPSEAPADSGLDEVTELSEPPAPPADPSPATPPDDTAPRPAAEPPEPADPGNDMDAESIPARVPLFAGGILLASAAIALLTRLRRSQARRRPPGHAPHIPPPDTAAIETALRQTADPARTDHAFAALRAFAAGLGDTDLPPLSAVRVSDTEVELLLASPAAVVPPGFDSDPDRRVFTTEAGITTTTLDGLAGDTPAPWPALVAAGAVGDDLVLIDLENAGTLTVDGPDAADTVRRIAAELATSPASELIEVLVVSDDVALAGTERIRTVESIDDAIDQLASAASATQAALDRLGDPATSTARRDHSTEQGWGVTALVSLSPLTEAQRDRVARATRLGCGVAVVAVGAALDDGWSVTTGSTTRLEPHGFDLSPATLTDDDLASIDTLFADATTGDSDERLLRHDSGDEPIYLPDPAPAAPAAAHGNAEIEVRVLGPVEVHGAELINRRRITELVAYLALHPGGVSAGRLKTAVWPEGEPTRDTFNVTVHRARSALGVDSDGEPHLPHAVTNGGGYSVGPHVTTDLARFNDLVRRSRTAADEATEADLLRQAVGLLRGQVLEGAAGYEWAFTEALVAETEATISDAAHRLAQLELACGDANAATWAATQGLKAVPGSEPLFRDRMEAAHLNGDPAAVDRIVEELCRYIETLEPLDDLHPDTVALWQRLGRNHLAATSQRKSAADSNR